MDVGTLADDKSAVDACKKITTYTPAKPEFNQVALDASQLALETADTAYNQTEKAFATVRDKPGGGAVDAA